MNSYPPKLDDHKTDADRALAAEESAVPKKFEDLTTQPEMGIADPRVLPVGPVDPLAGQVVLPEPADDPDTARE